MCDIIVKDLETLEIHLTTCEIYTCRECNAVSKNLSDLKSHFETEHENQYDLFVYHIKQSRGCKEEFERKSYMYKQLF